ncbi:MAG: hypothetical protein J6D06_05005 [Clostridia bacterium]|nr:hypothetical protein [Clostridia bacterium]
MFTVIFAEKETIKLFEETKMFFGPLLDSKNIAFCEWNKYADTFDEMVPDIYDIVEFQKEWRAIVLDNNNIEKINPFDFTEYSDRCEYDECINWEYLKNRRNGRLASYEKAVDNPLVKLTTALCEMPKLKSVISDDADYQALISGEMETYEFMLKSQFAEVNCREVAIRLERFQRESLVKFVEEKNIDDLIKCIENADVSGIVSLIPDTDIVRFIKFIGVDPTFYDPEYTECMIENTKRVALLNKIYENFSMKDKLPAEVVCLSPRTFDFENFEMDVKWDDRDEKDYSRFADFNLFNDKLKFMLYDILPDDNKQYKFDQIKMLCLLLLVANNDIPQGCMNANQVYRADIEFNKDIVTDICEKYISKLRSTEVLLKEIESDLEHDFEDSIDDETAERLFESDVQIPVTTRGKVDTVDLFANYSSIGLSNDCPENEAYFWSNQYRDINKKFIKYLREPRRAVKTAVNEGLKKNNVIDDDRSLVLSEFQSEDVNYHLLEEEHTMNKTATTQIYNTKRFNEQIEEADKEIKRGIAQRMSRSQTINIALVALGGYLFGFLPLIIGNLFSPTAIIVGLVITGVMMLAFAAVGLFRLFSLRRKLINRFKHFNYVISGICDEINASLTEFSVYLSKACNVMRGFSALEKRESSLSKHKKILAYHDNKIKEQIGNVNDMFSKYVDLKNLNIVECDPYDYDFTVLKEYYYEMPRVYSSKRIEYMQIGNEIIIPVDYVDSVLLIREELYERNINKHN